MVAKRQPQQPLVSEIDLVDERGGEPAVTFRIRSDADHLGPHGQLEVGALELGGVGCGSRADTVDEHDQRSAGIPDDVYRQEVARADESGDEGVGGLLVDLARY